MVIGEETIFSELPDRTPQVGPEAEVQIEKEHNKIISCARLRLYPCLHALLASP